MALSVRDVLEMEIIQRGEPEVYAGEVHLGRSVRWIHIADVAEIAPLLKGGELLLTSGLGIPPDPSRQRDYVMALKEAGVVAVVMTLGWAYERPPQAMVEAADEVGLPFIVLHKRIPFVEVTELVHSEIINRQFALLQKADQIGRSFTQLVLQGSGVRSIVDTLGRITNRPVFLENLAHQVVEFSDHPGYDPDVLSTSEHHARTGHVGEKLLEILAEPSDGGCSWTIIPVRQHAWGRLHVLHSGNDPDEIDGLAIRHAAIAIALIVLAGRDTADLVEQAGGDLIADLLGGSYMSENDVLKRARALGCDLSGKRIGAMAVDADDFLTHVQTQKLDEAEIQAVKRAMLQTTRKALETLECVSLAAIDSDEILAVVGTNASVDFVATLQAAGERIRELLPKSTRGLTATVGISREASTISDLARAFREAREAVVYGKTTRTGPGVYHFETLGLDTLILRLRDSTELTEFVEAELGPLLEHDSERNLKLLPTLKAYLENGMNKSATARAVHLERRSLYHRLERIGKLLDQDLSDVEACTRLFVALRGLAILRRGKPLRK